MAIVDVVVPSSRGLLAEAYQSLIQMAQYAECNCRMHYPWQCDQGKHSIRLVPSLKSISAVHWARNHHISFAMYGPQIEGRPPADFLMLVDDDMMCETDALVKLLAWNKDIVSGIATIRRDPPQPNIRVWKPELGRFLTVCDWDYASKELMPIDAVGAALLLVKRAVFKKMAKAYLNCFFERDEDRRKFPDPEWKHRIDTYWDIRSGQRLETFNEAMKAENWRSANCNWFQFLTNVVDTQTSEMGEDISFCWKAKKLGYEIFADPQVLPGHVGEYAYSVHDHIEFIEKRKRDGQKVPSGFVPGLSAASEKPIKHL